MMQRFTIGFPYAADRFGGSTASSLVLAHALQDAGHHIHVLIHGGEGRVADEAAALGLTVTHLPVLTARPGYARPDRFRIEQIRAWPASCAEPASGSVFNTASRKGRISLSHNAPLVGATSAMVSLAVANIMRA